ncbi:hypothetical protein [Pseudomonas putida]|uniref:hypothetical protein n=1 Tax=Pseudomonas putida TaxID=303 RepID=UPI0013CE5810|nr:hypothetical protein [Pseudomonas putida]
MAELLDGVLCLSKTHRKMLRLYGVKIGEADRIWPANSPKSIPKLKRLPLQYAACSLAVSSVFWIDFTSQMAWFLDLSCGLENR